MHLLVKKLCVLITVFNFRHIQYGNLKNLKKENK